MFGNASDSTLDHNQDRFDMVNTAHQCNRSYLSLARLKSKERDRAAILCVQGFCVNK